MPEGNRLSRIGERVTDLLSDDQVAAPPPPVGRTILSNALSRDDFDHHIRDNAGKTGRTLAGGVSFIGLSKVREKLGDRWSRVAARADEVARKAIERRLEPADVYTPHGELQYVVVFAHLTKEQAQVKCAVIAEEIMKRLLGEDIAPDLLAVKTAVAQADHLTASDGGPDVDTLAARLAAGDAAPQAKPAADDWWDSSSDADPLDSIRFVYRPLWDVHRNTLATYVCTPTAAGPAGRLLLGDDEIAASADAATVNRLDLLMQRRVIGDLRHMMASGHKLLLCLPVHFETLASNARRAPYLERCRRGIPTGGERFIAFEMVGAPPGITQGRLLELASGLKRHGRSVMLRTSRDHGHFRHPSETGVSAVGYTFHATGDERIEIENMQRFASAAMKAGVTAYIRGLCSLSLVTAAIGAGFDFVDGDIVSAISETPSNAYQFDMEDLFTRQMKSAPQQTH